MYKIETPTEAFSKPAISFQQNLKLTRLFAQNPKLVLDHFQLYQGMKILDVGCGSGTVIKTIAALASDGEFYGVDISEKLITSAENANKNDRLHFKAADAAKLPFDEGYFDIVICTNAFTQIEHKGRALIEMHRVLKNGGKFLLLESLSKPEYKARLDKIMRQSPFIKYSRKFIKRTALFSKSYFISAEK